MNDAIEFPRVRSLSLNEASLVAIVTWLETESERSSWDAFTRARPVVCASFCNVASLVSSAVILLLTEGSTVDLRAGGGSGAVVATVRKSEMDRVDRRLAGEEAIDAEERAIAPLRGEVDCGTIDDRDV